MKAEYKYQKKILKHLAAGVPNIYISKRARFRKKMFVLATFLLIVAVLLTVYSHISHEREKMEGRLLVVILTDIGKGQFYTSLEPYLHNAYDMTVETFLEKTNAEFWTYSQRNQMIEKYNLEEQLDGETMEKQYVRLIILNQDGNVIHNGGFTESFFDKLNELGF